ncbi:MAG: CARDB domain-containing protein [Thermoplasmatota archaeon]
MKIDKSKDWKRIFQVFTIIMLVSSGLALFVYNMPLVSSAQAYDVSLAVDDASKEVSAGNQVNYAFTITNEGNNGDRYSITSSVDASPSTGWQVSLSKSSTSNIVSAGTSTFTVSVRAPTNATVSSYCYSTIQVKSQADPTNSTDSTLLSTLIKRSYGVSIGSPGINSIDPGDSTSYIFGVKNEGNARDGYTLEATTVPTGWSASIDFDTGKIDPDETKNATMVIQSPNDVDAKSYQFVVKAQSITDNTTSATRTVTVNVNQTYGLSVINTDGVQTVDITSQSVVNYNLQLSNLGNGEDRFNIDYYISASSQSSGWSAALSTDATSKVVSDGSVNVTLYVYPPDKSLRPAKNSKGVVYVNVSSFGDPTVKRSAQIQTVVGAFYDVRILNTGASQQSIDPDESGTFTFNVTNRGNDADTFEFNLIVPDGFDASAEPAEISLNSDEWQLVTVTVTPDEDEVLSDTYTGFRIYANSSNHDASAYSSYSVKINKNYGVFLDAPNGAIIPKGRPGSTYDIHVRLQNKGNGEDSFTLKVEGETQSIETEWSPLISAATANELESDEYFYFNITVTAPSNATEGTYRFMVNASSQNSPVFQTIWLSVRIPQIYAVDISANKESVKGQFSNNSGAARTLFFDLDVYNRGSSTDDSISVDVKQAPEGFAGLYSIYFSDNSKSKITIGGDSSEEAKLEVDMPKISSGISAGTYQFVVEASSDNGTISDTSDDKVKTITLNLVLEPVHRVKVLTGINSSQVALGSSVTFSVIIQNRGTASDYYQLSVEYPDYGSDVKWEIPNEDLTTDVLAPLEQQTINLTATVSVDADPDLGSVWTKVTATHNEDLSVFDERYFTAIFADDFSGNLATDDNFEQALPGDVASFKLSLVNRGTRTTDTFTMEVEKNDVSDMFDNIVISPALIVLASDQRTMIWVNVTVPSIDDKIIETGTYEITIKATSEGETTQDTDDIVVDNSTLKVKVMPVYKVQFLIPEGSKSVDPGERINSVKLNITNKGNEPATINVNLGGSSPSGYNNWVSISPATISGLGPNSATDVIATINVPRSAIAEKVTFNFNASVAGKNAFDLATFEVDVNKEYDVEITVPDGTITKEREPGENASFELKLKNEGNTVDGFDIELNSVKSNWATFGFKDNTGKITVDKSVNDLPIEGDKLIGIIVEVPESASKDNIDFTIKAISKGDDSVTFSKTVTVSVEANRDVELVAGEETKDVVPEVDDRYTEVEYEVQVTNKGEAADTFRVEVIKTDTDKPEAVDQSTWDNIEPSRYPEWVILSKKVTSSIPASQSETITVTIRIPDSSYRVFDFNTTIWAYSEGETKAEHKFSNALKLITKVKQAYGADIRGTDLRSTFKNKTDSTVQDTFFDIEVKNTGTGLDSFKLEIDESLNDNDFEFKYDDILYDVGAGKVDRLRVYVIVDQYTLAGRYSFRARYISEGDTDGWKVSEDYVTSYKDFTIDVKQVYGAEMEAVSEELTTEVGLDAVFNLKLRNLGNDDDTFEISVREEDSDHWATLSNTRLSLDANGRSAFEKEFTLTVRIPDNNRDALAGFYWFNVSVERENGDEVDEYVRLRVEVKENYEHALESDHKSDEADTGDLVYFQFTLHNRGNCEDTYDLDIKGNKDEWGNLQYGRITLQPDEEVELFFNVTVPDLDEVRDAQDVEADIYEFTIEVSSKGDRDKRPETIDFSVDVEQQYVAFVSEIDRGGESTDPLDWDVNDDKELEITVLVENRGNSDDTFRIKKPNAPMGWEISVSPSSVSVPMGDEKEITITITFLPTDGFFSGYKSLKFELQPDQGSTVGKKARVYFNIHINALVPNLEVIKDDIYLPDSPENGEIYDVTVTVYNRGSAAAEDVEVILYDGNKPYTTDLETIPANGEKNFTFEWKATSGEHRLEVRVNDAEDIIETTVSDNQVKTGKIKVSTFNFSSLLGNLWFVGFIILIALLAILVAVLLAMNKNREIKELEEIITKLKSDSGQGGPRKVMKEAAGAPIAGGAAAGLPSAPGKLAPVQEGPKGGKKENVKVQCPKCMTQQVVTIDKRPAEVPCKECGVTLVVPEKKK